MFHIQLTKLKKICDKCIWLEDGKIVMQGDAQEVCDAYVKSAKSKKKKKVRGFENE